MYSDDEDKEDKQMLDIERAYGGKVVYENNDFVITSKDSIEEYSKLAKLNKRKVIKMTKLIICADR